MRYLLARFALVIMLFATLSSVCRAQFNSSLQGTVEDSSGAAVPTAVVTLTNTDNNVSQKGKADSSGVYRFSSLAPGNYQISAEAPGFSASKVAVVLATSETRNVPVTLSVGQNFDAGAGHRTAALA